MAGLRPFPSFRDAILRAGLPPTFYSIFESRTNMSPHREACPYIKNHVDSQYRLLLTSGTTKEVAVYRQNLAQI